MIRCCRSPPRATHPPTPRIPRRPSPDTTPHLAIVAPRPRPSSRLPRHRARSLQHPSPHSAWGPHPPRQGSASLHPGHQHIKPAGSGASFIYQSNDGLKYLAERSPVVQRPNPSGSASSGMSHPRPHWNWCSLLRSPLSTPTHLPVRNSDSRQAHCRRTKGPPCRTGFQWPIHKTTPRT